MANNEIKFEDVKILAGSFRNFSRKRDRFGNDKMNFNFAIDPETAERMKEDGFNVRSIASRDEDEEPTYFAKVNVNFESNWPPTVTMITKKDGRNIGKVELNATSIANLDYADIISADIWVNAYKRDDNAKKSMYLRKMYVFCEDTPIDDKYNVEYDDTEEDTPF